MYNKCLFYSYPLFSSLLKKSEEEIDKELAKSVLNKSF
jgi:hypothetical protein